MLPELRCGPDKSYSHADLPRNSHRECLKSLLKPLLLLLAWFILWGAIAPVLCYLINHL
jgi:hypothetical protein